MVKCQYETCMGKLIMYPLHIFIIIMKQYDEIYDMCLNTLIITRMLVFYNVRKVSVPLQNILWVIYKI